MEGYAKISHFMSEHAESTMVHRFSDINLQNILYLQAEIHGLRKDLRAIEEQNQNSSSEDVKQFPLDWYTLACTLENGKRNKQWEKVLHLRPLLKEYNEAVLLFHQLSKLERPRSYDLNALQDWLRRPTLGGVYLTGRDRDVWFDGTDLMLLAKQSSSNYFTRWLSDSLAPKYYHATMVVKSCLRKKNKIHCPQEDSGIAEYSDTRITTIAQMVGAVLASLLPILAIVALHLVHTTGTRLGLVTVFSAIFSTALWFLNDGKLIEVFSATSAFAAVQVVFIGTNG
ncbi:hypothetical protein LTR10_011599 [Elasticomyces elasticus]|uniref:DUF6594 domain-containing protein n=1 Tax=Exophiala sideris TaxID=1016849 RepID=A0ABR0JD12_9EURO|nr:hypothetical protein LTR10_011599 [Elasticomyces elasticus]KAK5031942.1 hypothetical protein LTS07_004563 [Exophiala sideris]KAK5040871.1 hypothetical protein LTR13_003172 [Exophiala sideris]KAK5061794.1 hypothetical protein LTR69_004977 [Exophiala sideris]KAK5184494.1 hypothetical protein LTR44_003168 [Eurotiomycetes sp. CCFEE 6388]